MLRDEELDEDQYWFLKSSRISAETVRDTGEKKGQDLEESRKVKDVLVEGTGAGGVSFYARICLAIEHCSTVLLTCKGRAHYRSISLWSRTHEID